MKHTKGLWEVDPMRPETDGELPGYVYVRPTIRKGSPIARVNWQPTKGEGPANARLIAAAPDLADALRDLELVASRLSNIKHQGGEIGPDDWSDLWWEIQTARAALAKLEVEK